MSEKKLGDILKEDCKLREIANNRENISEGSVDWLYNEIVDTLKYAVSKGMKFRNVSSDNFSVPFWRDVNEKTLNIVEKRLKDENINVSFGYWRKHQDPWHVVRELSYHVWIE